MPERLLPDGSRIRTALVRIVPSATMLAALWVGLAIPLRHSRIFYFWDDTAAAAAGVWQKIGESVLHGEFPVLVVSMWGGGNLAAEAATGMWNPIMLPLMLLTHPLDDFALAITLAKFAMFTVMAIGVYLLSRSYGATPWWAAIAGLVLPLSGYTLYTDGGAWINGLAVTAFTPLAWWAARRCVVEDRSLLVMVFFGYTLISTGNPYSLVALFVVALALGCELLVTRHARAIWRLALGMAATVALGAYVYLPFVLTSSVTGRANTPIANDNFMAPALGDLLAMSSPSLEPQILGFASTHQPIPAMYLAWFVLPLLPWLRWRGTGRNWRALTGLFVFGSLFVLLSTGPSYVWMFRMPIRLIPMVYLVVIVVFAVIASAGWATERTATRAWCSGGLVILGFWLAWADVPDLVRQHAQALALVTVLTAVTLSAIRLRRGGTTIFGVLAAGMLIVLVAQTAWMPIHAGFYNFSFPHSRRALEEQFADRSTGNTFQIGSLAVILPEDMKPDRAWRDLAFGNNYSIAGVESLTAYTGLGFSQASELCLTYYGGSCPEAWDRLFAATSDSPTLLVDQLRVDHVVVQRGYGPQRTAPPGWRRSATGEFADTYSRVEPRHELGGRVSTVGSGVTKATVLGVGDTHETLRVSTTDGSDRRVLFARLAWPGYSATLNGRPLPVGTSDVGLLSVSLPPDVHDGELRVTFVPPGFLLGALLACVGIGAIVVSSVLYAVRRRRGDIRQRSTQAKVTAGE